MNKKQLIVIWVMGISISIVAYKTGGDNIFWSLSYLLKFGFPILIIGGLLIYTLRDKKKYPC